MRDGGFVGKGRLGKGMEVENGGNFLLVGRKIEHFYEKEEM